MYRALIVEDEDLMREYLADNLSSFCAEWIAADTASDGQEAIENWKRPDLMGLSRISVCR